MILKIFKNDYFIQLIVTLLLALLLWTPAFISPQQALPPIYHSPIYEFLYSLLVNYKLLSTIIALILIIIQGFLLNSIFTHNYLTSSKTILPVFIYILLCSVSYSVMTISPVLIQSTFLIIAIYYIFRSFDRNEGLDEVFTASIFLSLATLSFFPSILLVFWIWVSLINYRYYKWRYWFVSLLGFFTPIILLILFYFITDSIIIEIEEFIYNPNLFAIGFPCFQPIDWVFLISIFLFSFASLFHTISNKNDKNINYRKKTNIIIILFFIAFLPSIYLLQTDSFIPYLSPAICFLLFKFFTAKRKVLYSNILFSIFLLLVLTKFIFSLK